VGALWVIGGIVFLLGAFLAKTHQALYAVVGIALLIGGVALIFAKRVTSKSLDAIRIPAKRTSTK
jgi:uncharacterized membrane protein HdeD (DUF308 family)